MANPEHLAKLLEGIEAWNAWRARHPDVVPDLAGADLKQANLRHADFHQADLSGADLRRASLRHADFSGANLEGANLFGADYYDASFKDANLTRVRF